MEKSKHESESENHHQIWSQVYPLWKNRQGIIFTVTLSLPECIKISMSKYSIYWIYYLVLQLYPWNIYPFIYIPICVCVWVPRLFWSPLKMIDLKTPASIPSWGCANALQPICLMADKACRWERLPVDVPIFSGMCSCVCVWYVCISYTHVYCIFYLHVYYAYIHTYIHYIHTYIYICVCLINTNVWRERGGERESEREREGERKKDIDKDIDIDINIYI